MGFQVMVIEVRLPEVEFSDLGRPSGAALINDIIIVYGNRYYTYYYDCIML